MGEAAYVQEPQPSAPAAEQQPNKRFRAAQPPPSNKRPADVQCEEPRRKKPCSRELAIQCAPADGIEARLTARGETPRFKPVGPEGRQLRHTCTTVRASVSFWPSTLQWAVEGEDGDEVEASLLGACVL